jgi:hypothetical protein
MRAYEERIGRIPPLTQIDVSEESNEPDATSTDPGMLEKTEQNTVVH